ncbi:MAG: N-acetylglucosamine-6-phosphate deacetylase [Bacilli bacterium]
MINLPIVSGFKDSLIYVSGLGFYKTSLTINNGKIVSLNEAPKDAMNIPQGLMVVPGFINRHAHGANHSDAMYPSFEDIKNISLTFASEGITTYLATTMTQTQENIDKALINIREYINKHPEEGALVYGVHLEGPFISKKHKGAQPEHAIVPASVETFKHYQASSGNNIKEVTLAFEENGEELVKYLVSQKIVASLGHTDATSSDLHKAADVGLTSMTHTYNAMRPIHHREVGALGAAMLDDRIYLEVIADLIHVSKEALQILYRLKGPKKVTLITDSIEASHMEDGIYHLGGQEVTVHNSEARLDSGALAGSTLQMNDAIRNFKEVNQLSLTEAIDLATINPARCLGIDHEKGEIALGKDADFTIIDEHLNVYMTIRNGKVIYKKAV